MRLAIDAQSIIGQGPTGIARYGTEIARAIARIDTGNQYVLPYYWSPRRRRPPRPRIGTNFTYRRVPIPHPVVALLERRRVDLAWDRFIGSLDACVFPGTWARPLRRGGNVRVIYDLTYLRHPETLPDATIAGAWLENFARTADRMARFIAISNSVKQEMSRELGVEPAAIEVASPAVDRDYFSPSPIDDISRVRAAYDISGDYILHTGTWEPRKNIAGLIDAFSQLDEASRGDLTLVLSGHRAWGAKTVTHAIDRAIVKGGRVRTLGYVGPADLAALYSGARAFVYPSLYEGFGLPVLEAMACGVPVVASDDAAVREVAGGKALHVPALDIDGLSTAIRRVVDDETLRAELINGGYERVAAYSWDRSGKTVLAALLEAAS